MQRLRGDDNAAQFLDRVSELLRPDLDYDDDRRSGSVGIAAATIRW